MRLKFSTALVSLATTANRRSTIWRHASKLSTNETTTKPFFRIYYNDVYEVNLPPRHRFPMKKYAQVRKKVQEKVFGLSLEEQNLIDCGKYPYSLFLTTSKQKNLMVCVFFESQNSACLRWQHLTSLLQHIQMSISIDFLLEIRLSKNNEMLAFLGQNKVLIGHSVRSEGL